MSALTEAEKRERQQKALGAAFLAHQVTQLEKSVDSLSLDRSRELYDPKRGGASAGRGGGGAGSSARSSRAAGPSEGARARVKSVRVLDASVLVHALPLVKLWVREDSFKLIVPLAVISTLDQLKHAPTALRDQARLATQFLDAQLSIARQITATSPPGTDPPTIRLRAQAQGEEVPWSAVVSTFSSPAGFEVDYPDELVQVWSEEAELALARGEEPKLFPAPEADLIPKELRSTVQCALYFAQKSRAATTPSIGPASLVVNQALATPHSPSAILFPTPTNSDQQQRRLATNTDQDFLSLSSGDRVATVLDTFFSTQHVPIERVARAEVDAARDWFRERARAAQASREKPVEIKQQHKLVKQPSPGATPAPRKTQPKTSPQPQAPAAPPKPTATAEGEKEKPKRSGRSRGRSGAKGGEAKAGGGEKSNAPPSVKRTNSNRSRPTSGTLFVP